MCVGLFVHFSSLAGALDNRILDLRVAATPLAVSNDVVFVAIDSRSLREVGTWPWSRSTHADMLDALTDAGAVDVFFDIDFAFASDQGGDAAFVQALERAGGTTLLASFMQRDRFGPAAELTHNLPYAPFRELSWPAAVNIYAERDGLIRMYPSGEQIGTEFISSAAVLLAGGRIPTDASLEINYGFDPNLVPTLSAVDVANREFPNHMVAGRSVVVGAGAVELGDHYAVPLHQVVPGAIIHILAAETLLAQAGIAHGAIKYLAAALIALLLILNAFGRERPWRLVSANLLAACFIEGAALLVFQSWFLSFPTAFAHPTLMAFTLVKLARSLNIISLLLRRKDVQIHNDQALLSHLFAQSSDGIVILDEAGDPIIQSRSAEAMFGTDARGALLLPADLQATARRSKFGENAFDQEPLVRSLMLGGLSNGKHIEYLSTTSRFQEVDTNSDGPKHRLITAISARDVTELKRQEREIAYLSTHDERTGALRRGPFLEFLRARLQTDQPTSVFVLNLSRFKTINQLHGRDIGDALLEAVVTRLQSMDANLSAISRLDGDSFSFFVEQTPEPVDPHELAEVVRAHLSEPYVFSSIHAQIGLRVGFAKIDKGDNLGPEEALSRAEDALDAAKTMQGPAICTYDPKNAEQRERVRSIERIMPDAISRNELSVLYQPQNRLSDGKLIGLEALVRWRNEELGAIYPDEFIPIAEANGFINSIGRHVLEEAVGAALALPDSVTMAVNVSSRQFDGNDLLGDVQQALAITNLKPERLCLELTETALLQQDAPTIETMHDIASLGVTWALDDFGTGFSSMSYLSRLPLSKLKLDRSFTMSLDSDHTARTIVRSVNHLCNGLGIGFLCEGIETESHREILLSEGCNEGQGYYFGRPQTIEEIITHWNVGGAESKARSWA